MPTNVTKHLLRLTCDQAQAPGGIADALTGGGIAFWRGNPLRFQLLLLSNGEIIDLDDYASITVEVFASQAENLSPLMSGTLASGGAGWDNTVDADSWEDRTQQHAVIDFSANESLLDLDSATEASFWLVVSGAPVADPTQPVTFGAATLTCHEDATPGDQSGAVQPGNIIPNGATYDGSGEYALTVTAGRTYYWEDGGANDTSLVNGAITLTTSGSTTALGSGFTLHGTPSAAVTATVRPGYFLTADDIEALYARVTTGTADPNGTVTGKVGDLYAQVSGGNFRMWYCNGDGSGNRGTVWI